MATKDKSTVRPLKARPGAHYTCFGDGLCCTDLHGLGPLTKKEVRRLELVSQRVVSGAGESGFDEPMLRTRDDGGCLFLGNDRCDLHAALGADAKPEGCRRFPLGLTATPTGGRVTTRHRCPCRTMGERPVLRAQDAEPSLLDGRGKLRADRRVGKKIRISKRKKVSFEQYEDLEAELFERLNTGEDAATVLDIAPFPELSGSTWKIEADEMLDEGVDDTRFGGAISWFAHAIFALTKSVEKKPKHLSWDDAFDRAQARSAAERDPDDVIADWIADEIWAMVWTDDAGTFAAERADLATRLAIARHIRARLEEEGRRPDRAAAEAVAIVDLVGDSDWWEEIHGRIKL